MNQWTPERVAIHNDRVAKGKKGQAPLDTAKTRVDAVEKESDLHDEIIKFCNSEWPRLKYVHSQMNKKTTVGIGVPDFVIALPRGNTLYCECKRKGSKPTTEQLGWAKEMSMLGHTVHFVWSFQEFMSIVEPTRCDIEDD